MKQFSYTKKGPGRYHRDGKVFRNRILFRKLEKSHKVGRL